MAHQDRYVFAPFAQRRHADRHDVYPVIEIFAKQAFFDQTLEIVVRRGDDTDIRAHGGATADGHVFALLQDAKQPRLGVDRHVADLVEKQGAPLGLVETAEMAVGGAGKGALLVPEQLAFDQLARDCRHVDGNERPAAAPAEIVQRAGDEFLAGTRFTDDQCRQIGRRDTRDDAVDVLHRRRASDERRLLTLKRRFVKLVDGPFLDRKRSVNNDNQVVEIEGFWQIFKGAAFGGSDRRHQRRMRAHHDDRKVGANALDARQQFETVFVGHDDVGDHQIALTVLDPAPQGRGLAGHAHLVAMARERPADDGADRLVVIDHQDGRARHQTEPSPGWSGRSTRNVVWPGSLSNSTMPP